MVSQQLYIFWVLTFALGVGSSKLKSASLLQSGTNVEMGNGYHDRTHLRSAHPKIAIYTDNFGGYDVVREDLIPHVPPDVRAFYFLDETTLKKNEAALEKWKEQGWEFVVHDLLAGTSVVEPERLTAKELKFSPPDWLLTGPWEWLIHHDANIYFQVDWEGESGFQFFQERQHQALVLLDFCHAHARCCGVGNGFQCLEHDVEYLQNHPEKVSKSFVSILSWRDAVKKRLEDKTLSMPHYFDLCILMRNLKHQKAGAVLDAFNTTFHKMHEVQRDQQFLPVFLEESRLTGDTDAVNRSLLNKVFHFSRLRPHSRQD